MIASTLPGTSVPLSPIELAFARAFGAQSGHSPNFALAAQLSGTFSDDELERALERARGRHPRLVTRIAAGGDGEPYRTSEGVPAFPLRVLADCGEEDWIDAVKAELLDPFPRQSGPFARFVLLRRGDEADLVVVCDHGSCDGMSGAFLLRDVLSLLGDPRLALPPLAYPADVLDQLPASVARSRWVRCRARAAAALFLARSRIGRRRHPHGSGASGAPAGEDPAETRVCLLPAALSAERTTALTERCRAESVTVHAALCAAWLTAYASTLPEAAPRIRKVSSPISIRDRLAEPAGETAGMFLSGTESRVDCAPERPFWEVARDLAAQLVRGRSDQRLFFGPLVLRALLPRLRSREIRQALLRFILGPVDYDFSITNLGRLDLPTEYGSIRLGSVRGPLVNASPLERTVGICTLDGRMSMTLLFRESLLSPEAGRELLEDVLARLRRAVEQEA
ncbi:MAG: phthiocerol/phthiodiolone dimycocerosyl transferase family protein [Gaiellaceae bacterium]